MTMDRGCEGSVEIDLDPFVVRSDSPWNIGINLMACYFISITRGRIDATGASGEGTTFRIRLIKNPNQPSAGEENQDILQRCCSTKGSGKSSSWRLT